MTADALLPGPLNGVRVVEYGNLIAGPYCARVLGDLGADVIKVERPQGGDDSRRHGPFPEDQPHPEKSGLSLFLNANKRGITLDPTTPTGKGILLSPLETADVLVENQPPSSMSEAGLGAVALRHRFPTLVLTAITPYGSTGPYRDYLGTDLTINAVGGFSFGNRHIHREPLTTPAYQASYMAGLTAALATTVALLGRDLTGQGQLVDVAESQVIAVLLNGYHLPTYVYKGVAGWRAGNRLRLGCFPNCVLPCKDGYICIDCPQIEQYQRFLALIGDPEWVNDPRYRDRRAMSEDYPEEAEALISPWFMEHTKEEVLELCLENRIPCVPVRTMDEVAADPHLQDRGFFQKIEHPEAGELSYPGAPFRLSATPWRLLRPAPTLGQHNLEVLCQELGYEPRDLPRLRESGVI